jgi:flagellar biosynthesis GTPase FlhF
VLADLELLAAGGMRTVDEMILRHELAPRVLPFEVTASLQRVQELVYSYRKIWQVYICIVKLDEAVTFGAMVVYGKSMRLTIG